MAEEYAAQPPLPAQMIKQSVNAVVSALDRSIMHMDHDQWLLTASTDDFREGIRLMRRLTSKPIGMNALIEQSSRTYRRRMER